MGFHRSFILNKSKKMTINKQHEYFYDNFCHKLKLIKNKKVLKKIQIRLNLPELLFQIPGCFYFLWWRIVWLCETRKKADSRTGIRFMPCQAYVFMRPFTMFFTRVHPVSLNTGLNWYMDLLRVFYRFYQKIPDGLNVWKK